MQAARNTWNYDTHTHTHFNNSEKPKNGVREIHIDTTERLRAPTYTRRGNRRECQPLKKVSPTSKRPPLLAAKKKPAASKEVPRRWVLREGTHAFDVSSLKRADDSLPVVHSHHLYHQMYCLYKHSHRFTHLFLLNLHNSHIIFGNISFFFFFKLYHIIKKKHFQVPFTLYFFSLCINFARAPTMPLSPSLSL
uniref:Uncharacterized protein TCIL3000_3_700 n=1 Tax=Trypanosoma congolense (strain IL3000) TaxID=1068625 RepID=G0UJU4_TRYCI|nr:unnamed protein product [Trypanosoma congolense IL3000]